MQKGNCCDQMIKILNFECKEKTLFECPDALIYYNEKFDEYGIIIHDGEESYIKIDYCPWCGKKCQIQKEIYGLMN
ncbi:hypothetical protein M2475_002231 [Breznakia sp. PF5-3]|uniref:DUF6980 family protein n=1 Tax=unclassified Breznakia TaxID=2623764 RepID=UPI002405CF2C|nr:MULTISPECIES: hypothetical protein [unclassified Breznakia]MDF9825863.1 hypothetical protein [Breznakia sp. PM6-1]MDF9836649.1 hypothetical protein [Breznakia sp. PF5-3]MDF9838903.1 hypothetical protein [Breznakia sp. PFB2-8]MDF9860930.1 hypothetical protein [Breznakia sp. PH5-24]